MCVSVRLCDVRESEPLIPPTDKSEMRWILHLCSPSCEFGMNDPGSMSTKTCCKGHKQLSPDQGEGEFILLVGKLRFLFTVTKLVRKQKKDDIKPTKMIRMVGWIS